MELIAFIRLSAEHGAMPSHRASFAAKPIGGMGLPKADVSPSGRRYNPLMVNKTNAGILLARKRRNTGQMPLSGWKEL